MAFEVDGVVTPEPAFYSVIGAALFGLISLNAAKRRATVGVLDSTDRFLL